MSKGKRMFALVWQRGRGAIMLVEDQAGVIRDQTGRSWDIDPKIGWRKAFKHGARVIPVMVKKA